MKLSTVLIFTLASTVVLVIVVILSAVFLLESVHGKNQSTDEAFPSSEPIPAPLPSLGDAASWSAAASRPVMEQQAAWASTTHYR